MYKSLSRGKKLNSLYKKRKKPDDTTVMFRATDLQFHVVKDI